MENTGLTMDRQEFFRVVSMGVGAVLLNGSASCSKESPTPDPIQGIDFLVDLTAKGNENLNVKGGYVVVNNIIVAQTNAGQFIAVSSKCTYKETELVYKPTENQFYCPLDLSRFDSTGKVLVGPATLPLKQYLVTDLANGTLRIHS